MSIEHSDVTPAQYRTALYVLETLRDELPDNHVSERRGLNDCHYLLQMLDERYHLDQSHPKLQTYAEIELDMEDVVRATKAAPYHERGYDLEVAEWIDNQFNLRYAKAATDGGQVLEDPPEQCELPRCEAPVENFPEPYFVPEEIEHRGDEKAVMCDHHHVAAKILMYTREDPPYVDIGLYKETTYYARALAAETFGIPSQEKVNAPQQEDDA